MLSVKNFVPIALLFFIPVVSSVLGQEHEIKPGDAIEIVVYNSKELSQTVVVKPDGTVDLPFAQNLPVDGLALKRFQELLVAQLSRYLDRTPLITARFTKTYPVKVTVLGQVANPGLYLVANTATLPGAIGQAGGFLAGAQLSQVKLLRDDGANGMNQVIDLEKFYLEGNPNLLPILRDDDIIVVPGNPLATSVKVFGSVTRPGSYEVTFQIGLLDILFMAGGPTNDANLNEIKIVSLTGQNNRVLQFNIKGLIESKNSAAVPLVMPGDLVYVPKRTITWRKFMDTMRDISVFATFYLIVRYQRN